MAGYYNILFASMNVSSGSVVSFTLSTLSNQESILLQAQLFTTQQAVLFAFDRDPSLTDNDGALDHLSSAWLVSKGYTTIRFLFVNKTTGANTAGGANDRILIRGSRGMQVG